MVRGTVARWVTDTSLDEEIGCLADGTGFQKLNDLQMGGFLDPLAIDFKDYVTNTETGGFKDFLHTLSTHLIS